MNALAAEHVTDRTDAANPRGDGGHLMEQTALAELLEPAKLCDVEAHIAHFAALVEMERDLGVSFDTRDRMTSTADRSRTTWIWRRWSTLATAPSTSVMSTCAGEAFIQERAEHEIHLRGEIEQALVHVED